VVVAAGGSRTPRVPALAGALPARLRQLTALDYRNPARLPDGEVLVVGGSASGVQIADELAAAGRRVRLAVGRHVRVPHRMRLRNRGVIVNVGSALAFRGIPLRSACCGAKHAVKGFMEPGIIELAHEHSHGYGDTRPTRAARGVGGCRLVSSTGVWDAD
jgi:cation diffusion facilitator CzcD-associated flavoprotein CzcO